MYGRRALRRWLRQEHAWRDDGAGAHECSGNFRLRRDDQAGNVERTDAHHRKPVRGGRRFCGGQDVEGRFRRHRKKRVPDGRRLRRSVHRQYHVLIVRGARHEPPGQLATCFARSRESRLRGGVGTNPGQRDQDRLKAARHHHPQID